MSRPKNWHERDCRRRPLPRARARRPRSRRSRARRTSSGTATARSAYSTSLRKLTRWSSNSASSSDAGRNVSNASHARRAAPGIQRMRAAPSRATPTRAPCDRRCDEDDEDARGPRAERRPSSSRPRRRARAGSARGRRGTGTTRRGRGHRGRCGSTSLPERDGAAACSRAPGSPRRHYRAAAGGSRSAAAPYTDSPMASRLFRRRSATAAWIYAAVAFGILGTIVAARVLGLEEFGVFATALAVVGFFQILLDLTVEESLTKYGFRYVAARGLGAAAAALPADAPPQARRRCARDAASSSSLAPFADELFDADGVSRRSSPPRSFRSSSRRRTSRRPRSSCTAATTCAASYQAGSAALRLLAIVDRRAARRHARPSSRSSSRRRSRPSSSRSSGSSRSAASRRRRRGRSREDVRGHPLLRRPVERRDGRHLAADDARSDRARRRRRPDPGRSLPHRPDAADRSRRRELAGAARAPHRADARLGEGRAHGRARRDRAPTRSGRGRSCCVAVPVFFLAMPWLVRVVFGDDYEGAVDAARDRPARRGDPLRPRVDEVASRHDRAPAAPDRHARARDARRVPLVAVLGAEWGATGAAVAVLVSTLVFAAAWLVVVARLRGEVAAADRAGGAAFQP